MRKLEGWVQNKMSGRVENGVLRWFELVERMTKKVYDSGVQGGKAGGDQLESGWMV